MIFDCDGVLVDSEPLAIRVLVEAIAAQGISLSMEEAYRAFLGRSLATISAQLEARYGMPLSPAGHENMRGDLYALYRRELKPIAGIGEAISALRVPFAVASSSALERIELSLTLTGLRPLFGSRVYSASMVQRGKPAPDLFLHVAGILGADPRRTIVIEDSPAGIEAAHAAGMAVFGFVGGGHAEPGGLRNAMRELKPDLVFSDMRQLNDLVGSFVANKTAQ